MAAGAVLGIGMALAGLVLLEIFFFSRFDAEHTAGCLRFYVMALMVVLVSFMVLTLAGF